MAFNVLHSIRDRRFTRGCLPLPSDAPHVYRTIDIKIQIQVQAMERRVSIQVQGMERRVSIHSRCRNVSRFDVDDHETHHFNHQIGTKRDPYVIVGRTSLLGCGCDICIRHV